MSNLRYPAKKNNFEAVERNYPSKVHLERGFTLSISSSISSFETPALLLASLVIPS